MRPSQVLDLQAELIDRARDRTYRRYISGFLDDQYGAGTWNMLKRDHPGWTNRQLDEAITRNLRNLVDLLHDGVKAADAYWVSAEMMELLAFSNHHLPGIAQLESDLAPSPHGLVYLNTPLEFREIRGRMMKIHAIAWWPIQLHMTNRRGVACVGFTDVHDPDDLTRQLLDEGEAQFVTSGEKVRMPDLGRWHMNFYDMWEFGVRVGPEIVPADEMQLELARHAPEAGPIVWPYSFNMCRWLVNYWTMMNQTIVVSAREQADRVTARRVRRYKIPERVTVVQLRRRETDREYAGETNVEWQHRWYVKGHYRNQRVGQGRAEVKRIWIHPFIKGPADKPLIQTEKVYALTR